MIEVFFFCEKPRARLITEVPEVELRFEIAVYARIAPSSLCFICLTGSSLKIENSMPFLAFTFCAVSAAFRRPLPLTVSVFPPLILLHFHIYLIIFLSLVRIILIFITYFSTVVPFNGCVFLSCRPFVVISSISTGLVGC